MSKRRKFTPLTCPPKNWLLVMLMLLANRRRKGCEGKWAEEAHVINVSFEKRSPPCQCNRGSFRMYPKRLYE